MKNNTLLLISLLSLGASAANAQTTPVTFLEATSGAITGSAITYSFTGSSVTDSDPGSGNLRTGTGSGSVITITFSGAVDFFLNPVTDETLYSNVNFDTVGSTTISSNIFTADTGAFTFTDEAGGPTITASGSSLFFDGESSAAGPFLSDGANFGSASIEGITSITYTVDDVSNFESFNFSAVASGASVPEPTSSLLLGLSALGFVIRRKR